MKNIFTTLTIILIVSNLSCNSIDNSNKITEDQVKETVSNFFSSNEIGSELNTNDYVTDDFKIVELGGPYTLDGFRALITEIQGENIPVSRKWNLSNWSISIDVNSAHASFKNNGTFITSVDDQEVTSNPVWLESGYLVLVDGKLKIKYFQSEEVSDYLSK